MEWTDASKQSHPDKEGWYLTLYEFNSGAVLPLPLYYQFAWNVPNGIEGTIKYYSLVDNTPIDLEHGRIF